MADCIRFSACVRANGFTGAFEDEPDKFFKCSAWDVGSADMIRWAACCVALRELRKEGG